jgi:hypothetical protein
MPEVTLELGLRAEKTAKSFIFLIVMNTLGL